MFTKIFDKLSLDITMFTKIIGKLSTPEIVCDIGFGCGMLWTLLDYKNPFINLLNFPLISLSEAYFNGYFIMIGTSILTNSLPDKFKFIVPTSICMSVLYSGYKKFIKK